MSCGTVDRDLGGMMTSTVLQFNGVAMVASVVAHGLVFAGVSLAPAPENSKAANRLRIVQLVPLAAQAPAFTLPAVANNQPAAVPPLEVIPTVPTKPYDPSAVLGAAPGPKPSGTPSGTPSTNQPIPVGPIQIPVKQLSPRPGPSVPGRVITAVPPKLKKTPAKPSIPVLTPGIRVPSSGTFQVPPDTSQAIPKIVSTPGPVGVVTSPPPLETILESPLPPEFYQQVQQLGYVQGGEQVGVSTVVGIAEVEVSPDGTLGEPTMTVASSVQKLDAAAKAAIKAHFKPEATGQKRQVVFRFALNRTQPTGSPSLAPPSLSSPSPAATQPRNPDPGAKQLTPEPQEPVLPLEPGNGKLLDLGID